MSRRTVLAATALALVAATAIGAQAQKAADPAPAKPTAAKPATPPKSTVVRKTPASALTAEDVLYLARATLLSLNDANLTGNYNVLRELGSARFKTAHSAESLAQIFSGFRQARFNLGAVALISPQLTTAPRIDDKGMLRIAGLFPTTPLAISFDLAYAHDGGQWRIADLGVGTTRLASLPQPPAHPKPQGAAQAN